MAERESPNRSAIGLGFLEHLAFGKAPVLFIVVWAMAFAPGKTWLIPFAVLWITYGWMRHRSNPRS